MKAGIADVRNRVLNQLQEFCCKIWVGTALIAPIKIRNSFCCGCGFFATSTRVKKGATEWGRPFGHMESREVRAASAASAGDRLLLNMPNVLLIMISFHLKM